jgi:hypothetical protein
MFTFNTEPKTNQIEFDRDAWAEYAETVTELADGNDGVAQNTGAAPTAVPAGGD